MAHASDVGHDSDGKRNALGLDRAIADLASSQHGFVSRPQLVALGANRGEIEHRLRRGRLHLHYRGVYAVGHSAITRHGRWMAAVLAGAPGAVLSHRSAAALWGIHSSSGHGIDVTVPDQRRARGGIAFHRASLANDEVGAKNRIPVTSVPARCSTSPRSCGRASSSRL